MNLTPKPWICTRCARSLNFRALTLRSRNLNRRTYASKPHPQDGRPFRLAVIGSGPAGFYTAYKVMSRIDTAVVDMYEQLPVPFGLVRFGVAPDHPEVKNCQDKFEEVASSPRFNFIGNISIGEGEASLPLRSLIPHYDAVLFAYGASRDRKLGIPGEEELKGIYSARAFVGWYNGLPEYANLSPNLTLGEEAVIIGQGNVALDVARILLQEPDKLMGTDITENAVEVLRKSRVKRVRVVGRRGPLQAAFTIKEARELMHLPSVAFHPFTSSLIPENLKSLPRPPRRIMELLQKGSEAKVSSAAKSWSLDFCLSPVSFNKRNQSPSSSTQPPPLLGSTTFEKMSSSKTPNPYDPKAQFTGSGETVEIQSELAFRSIGYKSTPLAGFRELGIPFDDRLGIIPNDHLGRVVTAEADAHSGKHIPGIYCAGWVKRGPTGVIASTMEDAFSTAESIAMDWYSSDDSGRRKVPFLQGGGGNGAGRADGWEGLRDEVEQRGCRTVSWEDWKRIDAAERAEGTARGKEREKFRRVEDMLAVLD